MIWLYLIVFIFGFTFVYASWRAAPWLPMFREDVSRAISLAKLKEGEKFYDLGAGDGRTLIAAANAGAQAEGFEISLLPYLLAKIKFIFYSGKNKPKIYFRDFWKIDLSQADAVFVFLLPRIMNRMKEKTEKELKPGARVICYSWPMPGWQPEIIDDVKSRLKIYLYKR
jgi:SAM-dependent methyltransferase